MNIKKKFPELIFNTATLFILVWFVDHAYFELFTRGPRIHLSQNNWDQTVVEFTLNTPFKTNFVILITGFLGILASLVIFTIRIFSLNVKIKIYWIISIIGLLICVISAIVFFSDFMGSAFEGVG